MATKKKTNEDDFWMVSTGPLAEEVTVTMVAKTVDMGNAFEAVSKWNENIEYPVVVRIEDAQGNIVSEDSSSKSTYAKDWNKKFYVKEVEGIKYMEYTRHAVVLALYEIMKANGKETPKDLRDLNGLKFFAVVVGGKDAKVRFINWVETFLANGIAVPELTPKNEFVAEVEVNNTVTEIHPSDLPF